MHTIPTTDIEMAHGEARALRAKLSNLHRGRGSYDLDHGGSYDLADCMRAGLADVIGDETGLAAWFVTDAGLRLLGIEPEPERFQVTWKEDGAPRTMGATWVRFSQARAQLMGLMFQLERGDRITETVVQDDTNADVTTQIGLGLIPDPEELARLEHRADVISGVREWLDYVIAHPAVPVPKYPEFGYTLGAIEDSAGRDFVYLAAAALGVEATSRETRYGTTHTMATRTFGPLRYQVTHCSDEGEEGWNTYTAGGEAALAAHKAQQAGQNGADQ